MTDHAETELQAFIDYAARHVPRFEASIRGSPDSEILALADLVGRPPTGFYRAFAARMGRSTGGIPFPFQTDPSLPEVIEFYRTRFEGGARPIPDGSVAIAVSGYDFDLCLRPAPPGGTAVAEPEVIATEGPIVYLALADSLANLLYHTAFREFELPTLANVRTYSATNTVAKEYRSSHQDQPMRHAARALAEEFGFAWRPHSDRFTFYGDCGASVTFIQQYEGQGMAVALAGSDANEVARFGAEFQRAMPLKLTGS